MIRSPLSRDASALALLASVVLVVAGALFGSMPLVLAASVAPLLQISRFVSPAWLFSGALSLSVFSGNWVHMGLPIGLDRLLTAAAIAALLSRCWKERGSGLRTGMVHGVLFAMCAYAILSAIWAGTIATPDGFFVLLDRLLLPVMFFVVAPLAFRTRADRNALLVTLTITGAYLGTTALLEAVGRRDLLFPAYLRDVSLGIHAERARGPFLEAVANGMALYGCAVGAAIACSVWKGRARACAAAVVALSLLGTLFTLTRAVWLATAVASIVALLFDRRLRAKVLVFAAVALVATWATFAFVPGLGSRAESRAGQERPVWDRLNTNAAAVRALEEHPFFGTGWQRFRRDSGDLLRQADGYPLTGTELDVHNVFLGYATELGLIGASIWAVAVLMTIGRGIAGPATSEFAPWRLGLVALTTHWFVVANLGPLPYAFPNLLLWTWAGIVTSRLYQARAAATASSLVLPEGALV
jgi:O-antigen ligase